MITHQQIIVPEDFLLREGFKKRKLVKFSTKHLPPPPSGKKLKTKNDLLAMKQILYDMGPLTLVRWPL